MRYVLTPGVKLAKYACTRCGQVELLSQDEEPLCSNCEAKMLAFSLKGGIPVGAEDPKAKKEPGTDTALGAVNEIDPPAKKKLGRPPKTKSAGPSCSTCSKALVAMRGYTFKIDCESKTDMDYCSNYSEGSPFGKKR